MWNRSKKEDDIQYRPATAAPTHSEHTKEAIPTAAYPTRQTEYGSARMAATIGKSLVITGHVQGKDDLVIDGRLEGNVDLPENRLTIGASGHVQGGIRAREIVVLGTVQGNMEASERVEIKKGARVVGDLKAQRPVIEDEAYFKGNVETIRVDAPRPAPKPQQPAPPIVDAQAQPEVKPEIKRG